MLIHRGSSFNPVRVSFFIGRRGENCESVQAEWAEESLRQPLSARRESEYAEMSTACGGGSIMECARRHGVPVSTDSGRDWSRSLNRQRVERRKAGNWE